MKKCFYPFLPNLFIKIKGINKVMKMEILAPVGGMESLIAAVRSGADAVYFGSQQFNARRNADNFNDLELKEAISYCNLNEVKCYLTLNTLIKDTEFESAVSLAAMAMSFGIDGVIVQDLGLAAELHCLLPDLPLHASTQLSVHSPAALPILKKMGFKRVVTAREMSECELFEFCKKAAELEIEVETFIHGALCMCLSGQCYFSAFLGGRSANRGLCAGTCRLPFSAKQGTGYDLSLKDLSLVSHLKSLEKMGIASLKIEGRMKRPEYVACSVNAVRQALDEGSIDEKNAALLEQVFSRNGFTDGYFTEKLGRNMFGVRSEQEKALSNDALSQIHSLYRRERQKLPLKFSISIKANTPCKLSVFYKDYHASVTGDIPQIAINKPLDEERVKECLKKLGGTCYFAQDILVNIENGLMLPISAINNIKKLVIEKLNSIRSIQNSPLPPKLTAITERNTSILNGFFARFANVKQMLAAKNHLLNLKGYSLPAEDIISLVGSDDCSVDLKAMCLNAAAELPRATFNDSLTEKTLYKLKELGVKTVICSNIASFNLAKQNNFNIIGGFGLNIFNSYSLKYISSCGVDSIVISPELTFNEIAQFGYEKSLKLLSICYGRQPLMLTRNCPVKNGIGCKGKSDYCELTDRKNNKFPVICKNGFCEILNTKTTNISDSLDALKVDLGYLYFTIETPSEAEQVINDFLSGTPRRSCDFTRALYKSGVQ